MKLAIRCPQCAYENPSDAPSCGMCGELMRAPAEHPTNESAPRGQLPRATGAPVGHGTPVEYLDNLSPRPTEQAERIWGMPSWAFWLAIGSPIALLFAAGPFMRQWAWFLGALFHESGHTVAGLAFGLPSFPSISLGGHAVTVHGEQSVAMVWMIAGALGLFAWSLRSRPVVCGLVAVGAVLHPVLAFSSSIESVFLLGGHLGELAFATLCLHRALTGGFTHHNAERGAYSVLGWLLVGSNVALCAGLAWSPSARAWYHANGSYGLANDYVRLADRWDTTLDAVGGGMLVVSCLPVLIAGTLALWGSSRR